ncbi:hypothetical protein TASCI_10425 [Tenacibaculum ascidiaceicola]
MLKNKFWQFNLLFNIKVEEL